MPREGNVHTLENKVSWEPHGRIAQCPVTRKKKASEKGACSCREGNVRPVLLEKKRSVEVWHQNRSIPMAIWTCKTKPSSEKTQVALGHGASWGYVDGWKTRRRRGKTGWRWRTRGARVTVAGWVGSGME